MAVLDVKKIPPGVRCDLCEQPATVEVFDDRSVHRGTLCGKCGQAWLRRQREAGRLDG